MARAQQSRRDDTSPRRSSRSQQSGRVSRGHDDSDDRPAGGESTRGGSGEEDGDELAGGRTSSERPSSPSKRPASGRSTGRRRG